jgi:hypothetical protein
LSRNSAELDGRDEADEDPLRRAEGDGVGEAKSSVASSSVLPTGVPQAEQNRTEPGRSVLQEAQEGMNFPETVYRVGGGIVPQNTFRNCVWGWADLAAALTRRTKTRPFAAFIRG